MILEIGPILTIPKIESYHNLIASNSDIDLMLPLSIQNKSIGSKAFLYQFFNSWVRSTQTASIIINEESFSDNHRFISDFLSDTGNLILVLMTIKEKRKILDKTKNDLTLEIRKAALEKLKDSYPTVINRIKRFRKLGNPIAEFCFDHAKLSENKFNKWFYQDGVEEPSEISGFKNFYYACIEALPINNILKKTALKDKFVEDLAGIIKELFDNTHYHGRDGIAKVPLNPNMRGVYVDIHQGTVNELKNNVTEFDPYFKYFSHPRLFKERKEIKAFLEISVIDSGIGYAQKSTGKLLSTMNTFFEREKVIECLIKYDRTSVKRGLKRVAEYLSERKGFIMLRTGRLNMYRSFLLNPYQPADYTVKDYQQLEAATKHFLLWEGDEKITSSYQKACGSLVTILLPIE